MANKLRNIKYKCSQCGEPRDRTDLVAVQVRFYELGRNAKLLRTRTIGWLGKSCCLEKDGIWALPKHAQAPGMADTALANGGTDV